ncbi:transcriptional repressor [Streptomyces sp. NPDC006656]|uniref:Fur family transcriptional regulator n=1 Tax=Streptomyces sp. NPDC006656 TaxID=3156899 RepID=UPI0034545488
MSQAGTAATRDAQTARFAAVGLRRTRQRTTVLDSLDHCSTFISAPELHARMTASGSTVGLTTVYRTLRDLERAGLVDTMREEAGGRLYLRRRASGHRHYLVCRHCGHGQPVNADAVARWADQIGRASGFTDLEHTVELSGTCAQCRPAAEETLRTTEPSPAS